MIDADKQMELAERTFREITADGTLVSHEDMALAYMHRHPDFLKRIGTRRRRAANFIRRLRFRAPIEEKPTFKYRHQSDVALLELQHAGKIGHTFVDADEQPLPDPKPPVSYEDRRYFPVPPTSAQANGQTASGSGEISEDQLPIPDLYIV